MLFTNAAGILGVMLVTQLAPHSVSELLANADRFHGQPVTVIGTMSNFRATRLHHGGLYTFDLSDGTETVYVVAFAKPPCESGAATVEGTFETVKRRIKASDPVQEITAHNVICLPDTVDPRGPKTK
jgi:hypothetical protein